MRMRSEGVQLRGVAVRGRRVRAVWHVGRVGDADLRRGGASGDDADAARLRRPAHLLPRADQGGGGLRLRPLGPTQRGARRRRRERHRVRGRREEAGRPRTRREGALLQVRRVQAVVPPPVAPHGVTLEERRRLHQAVMKHVHVVSRS
jgi:hypothetical protein